MKEDLDQLWHIMRLIEGFAFDIPPPNQLTPEIVLQVIHARSLIQRLRAQVEERARA